MPGTRASQARSLQQRLPGFLWHGTPASVTLPAAAALQRWRFAPLDGVAQQAHGAVFELDLGECDRWLMKAFCTAIQVVRSGGAAVDLEIYQRVVQDFIQLAATA